MSTCPPFHTHLSTFSQIKMLTEEQLAKLDEYKGSITNVYDLYRFLSGKEFREGQEEMARVKWNNFELEGEIKFVRDSFPYNYDQAVTILGFDDKTFCHVKKVYHEINSVVLAKYDIKLHMNSDTLYGNGFNRKKVIQHVLKTEFPNVDPMIDLDRASNVFQKFIHDQKPELYKYLDDVIKKGVFGALKEESNKRVKETLSE